MRSQISTALTPTLTSSLVHLSLIGPMLFSSVPSEQKWNFKKGPSEIPFVIHASLASDNSNLIENFESPRTMKQTRNDFSAPELAPTEVEIDRFKIKSQAITLPLVDSSDSNVTVSHPKFPRRVESTEPSRDLSSEWLHPSKPEQRARSFTAQTSQDSHNEDVGVEYDFLPEPLATNTPPKYPANEMQRRIEGRVILSLTIEPNGSVSAIEVYSSSGSSALDQAAVDAAIHWRFKPWARSNIHSSKQIFAPIAFKLRGSP